MLDYCKTYWQAIVLFIVNQKKITPLVLFLQLGYLTIFGATQYSLIILITALLGTIIYKENYFWYVGVLIQPGLGYYGLINLVFGILSCNQRWKLLLLLFIGVFFLTFTNKMLHYAINIAVLLAISMETYYKLPFDTLKDNRDYFIGFVCLLVYNSFNFFLNINDIVWNHTIYSSLFLMAIMSFLSYSVINRKIWLFSNLNILQIDNPNQVYHYLSTIKQKSKHPLQKIGVENMHKLSCRQVDCFCKTKFEVPFERLYIRKLAKVFLKNFQCYEFKQHLQELYVSQLLEDNMFPLAVQSFLKQNNYKWDIFKEFKIKKSADALKRRLDYIQSAYSWKTVFNDPFEYQKNFEIFRRYILQLIQLKTEFWSEIIKKYVLAKRLKELGKQFLEKLNKMNVFYLSEIAPVEKEIKIFSGAILYNLFLLIGTNYKEMAETNIKALRKNNDPQQKKSYKLSIIKASLTQDRMGIIQNLNNNCVKMLGGNTTKLDYIGKSIDNLVPIPYMQQHCAGMRNLRQFNSRKLVGADLDVIYVIANDQSLIASSIFYKFSPTIFNQLSIISLLKHFKQDSQHILIDGDGNPLYTSDIKLDTEIVYSKQIQRVIRQFKQQWTKVNESDPQYPLPQSIKIQIKFKEYDYICIIGSPLCQSFKYPRKPPIHLSLKNATKTNFIDNELGQQADMGALKRIQVIMDQNQTQSQASSISRRSSIIEVLKMFESNAGQQLFKYFYIAISLVFIILVVCAVIQYSFTSVPWMVDDDSANTIKLFITHTQIEYYIAEFVSKGLSLYGIKEGFLTNESYSNNSNYSQSAYSQLLLMCNLLSKLIYDKDFLDKAGGSQYNSQISGMLNLDFNNGEKSIMMFNNMINLAVANCFQMSKGIPFWKVAMFDYYWSLIIPNYQQLISNLKQNVQTDLNYYSKIGIIIFITNCVLIVLSLIPIFIGNRRIQTEQDYIYDLMTSISPELLEEDILNLADLQISLKANYSNTFNFNEKSSSKYQVENNNQKSEIKTQGDNQRRKRAGELDTKGNKNCKMFIYCIIIIFTVFMISVFILRLGEIKVINNNFNEISNLKKWRNQRIEQIIGVKKLMFKLRPNELVIGQQIQHRIKRIFNDRRVNYPFGDSIEQVPIVCTPKTEIICKNGTVSQLSIKVFLFQLLIETYVSRDPQYLAMISVLKDLQKVFNDAKVKKLLDNAFQKSSDTKLKVNLIFILSLVYLAITFVVIMFYLKSLKKEHIYLSRFITFLSQDMIKKNKRVQSYLQRLMKNQ